MGDTTSFAGDTAAAEIAKSNAAAIAGQRGAAGFGDVAGSAGLGPDAVSSYPLSELSFAPGTSPLYTNPNIQMLGADGTSLVSLPTPAVQAPSVGVNPNVAGNMLSSNAFSRPVPTYTPSAVPAVPPPAATSGFGDVGGTGGFATPTQATAPVTKQQIADAYVETGVFDKASAISGS